MFLPSLYLPVAALVVALLIETWFKRDQPWALPAAVLYLTIGAWYFADLFISPENYDELPEELLNLSYVQIAGFLLSLPVASPAADGQADNQCRQASCLQQTPDRRNALCRRCSSLARPSRLRG